MHSVPVMETASPNRLTGHLPALRGRLERERAFRLEQLAELDAASSSTAQPGGQAVREVAEQVAAAATVALNDIDIALLRIDIGSYGRCQACHADIPIRLLEAIPQLRLCLACQHTATKSDPRHGEPVGRRSQRAPAFRAQTPARQRVRRGTPTAGRRDRHRHLLSHYQMEH